MRVGSRTYANSQGLRVSGPKGLGVADLRPQTPAPWPLARPCRSRLATKPFYYAYAYVAAVCVCVEINTNVFSFAQKC